MSDVPIGELKARLSYYLERAARGEVIRVTDRGRPKAVLGPLPGQARLDEGIASGWIRAPESRPAGPWRRLAASRLVAEMLAEDRGA